MSTTFEKSAAKTISLPLERRKREYRVQAKQFLDAFFDVHEKYSKEYLNLLNKIETLQTIEKKNISQRNLESFHKEAFSLIKMLRGKADYFLGIIETPVDLIEKLQKIKSLTYEKWIKYCLKGTSILDK